ncbi:hypothetical protein U5D37_004588 [Salmonella enterica]|nr:hypothetical protein [Salmonella enterica]
MNTNTLNTVYNSMINTMNMVEFDLDSGFILCQNEDYDYTEIGRTYYSRNGNPTFYLIHDNETHFLIKKNNTIYKKVKKENISEVIPALLELLKKDGHQITMKH